MRYPQGTEPRGHKMSKTYAKSTTRVSDEAIMAMQARGLASEWVHPRTGEVRHYLNRKALEQAICLRMTWHDSGTVRSCEFELNGEMVDVSNRRAYHNWHKVYVADGIVHSDWNPYPEYYDMAEEIARGIDARFGAASSKPASKRERELAYAKACGSAVDEGGALAACWALCGEADRRYARHLVERYGYDAKLAVQVAYINGYDPHSFDYRVGRAVAEERGPESFGY